MREIRQLTGPISPARARQYTVLLGRGAYEIVTDWLTGLPLTSNGVHIELGPELGVDDVVLVEH
jgi:hypothetical protein